MVKKIFVSFCIFVVVLSLYGLTFVAFKKANEYFTTSTITLKF
jgi:CHASE3 domain sensor protein